MFHRETTDAEHFEQVILRSVKQILETPDPERFLEWSRQTIPSILGLAEDQLSDTEIQRLATLLGTLIWNATPQPNNDFQPRPLVPPPADAPCPCGSGYPYHSCCGNLDEMPELSPELVWEILLDEIPASMLQQALTLNAIPQPLLAKIAERWLDEGRPGRVVTLLEPLFAASLDGLDERYETAFDALCDAYDRLDHWRKKLTFLTRVCAEGSQPLQAAAWQRRSTMHIDQGDFARAEEAFAAALRCDPDNPSTALLEITLLAAQHKDVIGRKRARFWLHRFRRLGFTDEGFMEFLARAILDPQEAMVSSHADVLDPLLIDLHDWVAVLVKRPLPSYRLTRLRRAPPRDAVRGQLSLFEPPTTAGGGKAPQLGKALLPLAMPSASQATSRDPEPAETVPVELRAPEPLRRREIRWRGHFPWPKPQSTHLALSEGIDVWESVDWLEHLLQNPETADSLDVLDDLATALYEHPESSLPWIAHALLRPLLERAWDILSATLPDSAPYCIPWSATANRPALRLLFRRYLCQVAEGEPQGAVETLETLLRLNPSDNHGIRAELINQYLRDGDDEQALALARRFPDDRLADLAYGEVLALYRLGLAERARQALSIAVRRLPRVPYYLTRKRIKQPRLSALGVTPGSDDQAWLYREAMRDVWAAEPGALSWLKRWSA